MSVWSNRHPSVRHFEPLFDLGGSVKTAEQILKDAGHTPPGEPR